MDLSAYSRSLEVGAKAGALTGRSSDIFPAGAYSAFIHSVTGKVPTIVSKGDNRISLVLDESQIKTMKSWLDQQIQGIITPSGEARVQYELGPVIKPVALKYTIPLAAMLFIAGFMARSILK